MGAFLLGSRMNGTRTFTSWRAAGEGVRSFGVALFRIGCVAIPAMTRTPFV
jgi:hypothetical protein